MALARTAVYGTIVYVISCFTVGETINFPIRSSLSKNRIQNLSVDYVLEARSGYFESCRKFCVVVFGVKARKCWCQQSIDPVPKVNMTDFRGKKCWCLELVKGHCFILQTPNSNIGQEIENIIFTRCANGYETTSKPAGYVTLILPENRNKTTDTSIFCCRKNPAMSTENEFDKTTRSNEFDKPTDSLPNTTPSEPRLNAKSLVIGLLFGILGTVGLMFIMGWLKTRRKVKSEHRNLTEEESRSMETDVAHSSSEPAIHLQQSERPSRKYYEILDIPVSHIPLESTYATIRSRQESNITNGGYEIPINPYPYEVPIPSSNTVTGSNNASGDDPSYMETPATVPRYQNWISEQNV